MLTDIKIVDMIFEMKVSNKRAIVLNEIVNYINKKRSENKISKLNFICTHNSRRSQFCQFWATFFSNYYNIRCEAYSGGTVETEVYKSVVNNIRDYGFNISFKECNNPIYSIKFKNVNLGNYFSKFYYDFKNPKNEFAAIMTCSDAEKTCPFVEGSEIKFYLPYEDPKKYDKSKSEKNDYKKTSEKIASEMNYLFYKLNA
ncbi:MAG: protein-tyrosine-phosphatase [Flavobacteriaceae bacterium]|tara:strand:- start:48882 stop:49481 length:600 start_codon:yes stop_codon:yes gene_type:complete